MHPILEIRNLNRQEKALMEALLAVRDPISQADLMERMRDPASQATVSRAMTSLVGRGLVVRTGQTKGARFVLSDDARRVATDPRRRPAIAYDPDRIRQYVPNETRWLPEDASRRMVLAVSDAGGQALDASTYRKAIAERFLIDLAWASSSLEGNTYDHLSTEVLIKYGESASGRDRLETAMILNHKNAIGEMLDGLDGPFPDLEAIQRRHALMMRDLMDPFDIGAIRRGSVRISASSYRPSTDPVELKQGLGDLLAKAARIDDPFESSFFLLAGTSYLQAFGDGNKRTGRLLASEPLLRAGLPPLSFVGIDKGPYIMGLIEFYETGATALLGETIAEAYALTAADYTQAVVAARVPHALELRERERISGFMGDVFRNGVPTGEVAGRVPAAFPDLSAEDQEKMTGILVEIADRASPASAILYGVQEDDIRRRRSGGGDLSDGPQ